MADRKRYKDLWRRSEVKYHQERSEKLAAEDEVDRLKAVLAAQGRSIRESPMFGNRVKVPGAIVLDPLSYECVQASIELDIPALSDRYYGYIRVQWRGMPILKEAE